MKTCECGRVYHHMQRWIHEPACRYLSGIEGRPEVTPNHVKLENRGYTVTEAVTRNDGVTEIVTKVLSNAERQRRWREKQRADSRPA